MMRKTIVLLAVAAVLLVIAPATQADIALPDPSVGSYRLVFVTTATASGATDLPSLDAWVTLQAQATGAVDDSGALGTTWHVLGATTAATNARANTNTEATDIDTPVYLVNGEEFAADLTDFWSGTVTEVDNGGDQQDTLYITEMGIAHSGTSYIQTGLLSDGSMGSGLDGGGNINHGGTNNGYSPFFGADQDWGGTFGATSLFAISGVIGGAPPAPTGTLILVR
jgi:hypothetical protein